MENSPLVQDARPSFQPKIAHLYEELFTDEDDAGQTEGFWTEFFLLRPDRSSLHTRLESLTADDLLHAQHEAQQLFFHAIQNVKAGRAPSDEIALETLTVFLAGVLAKRYTNPSSDIISVLAGLDQVDVVFSDFSNAIDTTIRNGRTLDLRKKAIEAALSLASGAYQTSLVSYFTHRDLFPSLMKYIQESDAPDQVFEPFVLLGLLANYNKFEYRNPYRVRLEDFVNESIIEKIIRGLGEACSQSRNKYTAVIEDSPDMSWTLSNALSYIGLGVLAPIKAINPMSVLDDSKDKFSVLPGSEATLLLATYDFVNSNKLFSHNLFSQLSAAKDVESPFSSYLSQSAYILHHAHLSARATLYGILSLSTLRIMVEDTAVCKLICNPDASISVRLCRQRQPFLPAGSAPRPAVAQILDISVDTINHNLRRRLDVDLHTACLNLVHRLLVCLVTNHIHLAYHWSLLWHSLLTLIRFLQNYASHLLAQSSDIHALVTPLLKILALAMAHGTAFLPDPAAYDDFFYRLVEWADILTKFKSTFNLSAASSPIDVLIATSAHFHRILEEDKGKGKMGKNPSPKEVHRIIKEGYESLEVSDMTPFGISAWEPWREGEERGMLKRVGRVVVEDVRRLLRGG